MKKLFKYSLSPLLLNLSVNGALERSQGLVIMIGLPLCFSFDETGVYQYYLISATLIASICTFGLPQVVLSQISEMQKKDQNVYQKYFVDIHFVIIITVFLVTVIIGGLEEIIFRSQALLILSTNLSNSLIFFLGIGLWASCLAGDQMCNALITGTKEFKYLKKINATKLLLTILSLALWGLNFKNFQIFLLSIIFIEAFGYILKIRYLRLTFPKKIHFLYSRMQKYHAFTKKDSYIFYTNIANFSVIFGTWFLQHQIMLLPDGKHINGLLSSVVYGTNAILFLPNIFTQSIIIRHRLAPKLFMGLVKFRGIPFIVYFIIMSSTLIFNYYCPRLPSNSLIFKCALWSIFALSVASNNFASAFLLAQRDFAHWAKSDIILGLVIVLSIAFDSLQPANFSYFLLVISVAHFSSSAYCGIWFSGEKLNK